MPEQKTLKEEAEEYTPQTKTNNIADLERVPIDAKIEDDSFKDSEGETVNIKIIVVDEQKYRVPVSVINALKMMLEDKPDLKHFKVKKQGKGFDTRYTVIPLE